MYAASTGEVRFSSNDSLVAPVIDLRFFSNPAEHPARQAGR